MSELRIPRVEQADIQAPRLTADGTTIVLQRHEAYQRDRTAENAGSITATGAYDTDAAFFRDVLGQEHADGPRMMILFVSSDTQYAGRGHRSVETTDLALQAATDALRASGIDPAERIVNLHPGFHTDRFEPGGADVRLMPGLREPQLFDASADAYLKHLLKRYGDLESGDLSVAAWAAHEADAEREAREHTGTEGVHDIIARTKAALYIFQRYAAQFHASNPDTHLVVWAGTHYDTISPLVKDATDTPLDEYIPVAYGGGVVIDMPPSGEEPQLAAQRQRIALHLGGRALT